MRRQPSSIHKTVSMPYCRAAPLTRFFTARKATVVRKWIKTWVFKLYLGFASVYIRYVNTQDSSATMRLS